MAQTAPFQPTTLDRWPGEPAHPPLRLLNTQARRPAPHPAAPPPPAPWWWRAVQHVGHAWHP